MPLGNIQAVALPDRIRLGGITVSSGAPKTVDVSVTFANGMSISGSTYDHFSFSSTITQTDLAQSGTLFSGIKHSVVYGSGGVASKGQAHSFTGDMIVSGNGHADDEHAVYAGVLRYDIGTGFTQTGTPAGRGWFTDWSLHGAIGIQQSLLSGLNMFVNNYYNGSPSSGDATAIAIMTKPASGGALDATHQAATTYPWDVGLVITGASSSDGVGFTTALRIGGAAAPWTITTPFIGTGINIANWATNGINISGRTAAATGAAISIADGAGPVLIGSNSQMYNDQTTGSLLEVTDGSTRDPLAVFGSTTNDVPYSVYWRNGQGVAMIAVSGGNDQFMTGSVTGDMVIKNTSANKAVLMGGTTRVIEVTTANTLGFFAATPVAQQAFVADPSGGATIDSQSRTAIASIIDTLINLGLMAAS